MKKIILFIALLIPFPLAACNGEYQEAENQEKNQGIEEPRNKLENAEEIVTYLIQMIENISDTKVYNEENDPNELLGRPGGYISKVDFIDSRVEERFINNINSQDEILNELVKEEMRTDFKVDYGGSVELFDNKEDAKNRYEYISTAAKESGGAKTEYGYLHENVYLRLSKSLTPTEAEEYEKKLIMFIESH